MKRVGSFVLKFDVSTAALSPAKISVTAFVKYATLPVLM